MQSSSADAHSFTVMPLLFISGKLGDIPFVQLQENSCHSLQRGIFRTKNLFAVAGYSYVITIQTMLSFFEHIFVPQMPNGCNVVLDSWGRLLKPRGDSTFHTPKEDLEYWDYTSGRRRPNSSSRRGLLHTHEVDYVAISLPRHWA